MMELHSESESDRAVLAFRGPRGEAATVIVMRKNGKVWMVFNGALKTTVAMTDEHADQLTEAVTAASRRSG
jgi:streptogramin lyase